MRAMLLAGLLTLPNIALGASCALLDAQSQFEQLLTAQTLQGGALLVGDAQGLYLERYLGSYSATEVVSIASASKLLSAVRIAQLVDRGQASLDEPVSTYLPQFTGDKGTMTLRQMFSHSAGYGDDSFDAILLNPNITLAQAVNQIACCRPLNPGYSVGGQFSYGGVSMHIAGRVAEVRGGGDWQQRWVSEIATPLGINSITWQGATSTNYMIAGGARSNLRDYGRVLQMLVNGGRGNGTRVLSRAAVAQFATNQVGNLPIAYVPPNVSPPVRYGLGSWLYGPRDAARPPLVHSLGAFGFFPWIDFESNRFGVFMVRATAATYNANAIPIYLRMVDSINAELNTGCEHIERFEEIWVDGFE